MVAIRDAQLEKHKPAIKNKMPTAILSVFLVTDGCIAVIVSAIALC
jgi:hypothetical protein